MLEETPEIVAEIHRRELVQGALSLFALLALPSSARADPLPDIPECFIDSHCHVFNGKDVPAGQFILLVAMRERDMEDYAPVVAFFVRILRRFAPTAVKEDGQLGPGLAPAIGEAEFRRYVFETLQELAGNVRTSPTPIGSKVLDDMRTAGIDIESESFKIDGEYASEEALALAKLRQNYDASRVLSPDLRSRFKLPKPAKSSIDAFLAGAPAAERKSILEQLTDEIVSDVRNFFEGAVSLYSKLTAFMGVLRIFLSYRHENVLRLDKLYGRFNPNTLRLYCGTIIDFDVWLGQSGEDVSTPVKQQAALMGKIARATPANVLVHGFVPFDPLRAIVEEYDARPHDGDAKAFYREHVGRLGSLIEDNGMIGFKLYPPMGFRAWGNTGSNQSYVTPTYKVVANLRHRLADISEAELSQKLDQALNEFYIYCISRDLPILTHCSNSQTAFEGSGERASPAYWRELLKRPGFSKLRVNLGHSGGVWCKVEIDTNRQNMSDNEFARCQKEIDWFKDIVDILTATADGQWAYPNVSFDIADILTLNNSQRRNLLIAQMKTAMGTGCKGQRARQRILYGTDWMFLAFDADSRKFLDGAKTLARDLPVDPKDLFWRNAADFMGLVKTTGATNARLRQFYASDEVRRRAVEKISIDARPAPACS